MTRTKKRLDVAELRRALERTHPRDVASEHIKYVPSTATEGTLYTIGVGPDAVLVLSAASHDEVVRAIASIIEADREAKP